MLKISVIIGSTRRGRFSEKPAHWIVKLLQKRSGITTTVLDLREFPLPFFDEPIPPTRAAPGAYENETVRKWSAAVGVSDGFVFVSPEYNFGPPAVLKNALDWVYVEWNRQPSGFVSYGGVGGARSVQQLREIAVELQMSPIRSAVHIPMSVLRLHFQEQNVDDALAELNPSAEAFIDDLLWWTSALHSARSAS